MANTANSNNISIPEEQAVGRPVTMPLLGAMLSDDTFVNEAKTALQITDEQIQRLREASQNAVSNLDESDEDSRSTRAAMERAEKQIQEVLGQEKAARFIALVQQRWGGENDGGTLAAQPNSVPTDTRIVVNAPAYRMDIFKEGKLAKTYKIGIGYPEFPLPTGLRKASTIIFNPTWTPPDEPWVKGKVQPGKKVEAGDKLNPLGPIKIPIGLPSLIHGGKSPARLGTFASHGCVGLTSPQIQDFAMEISNLSGEPLTMQDIKNYEKTKTETKEVKLEQAIPVELRYETIVIEDGKLKIFRDVYEHGTNTEENLRRVLEVYGVSLDNLKDREKILAGLTQMAVDSQGKAVEMNQNINSNVSNNSKMPSNSGDGSVTKNIKGKKEVVFVLAELKGKGYPAPVNMKM
ncbi:MAG: L,D-transpeptidase [Pyrinomonadaceae bacterium]